mmetsp:Transcript_54817/g.171376  ORF Transcript_54817/g.171376 Transcript_54817/m.171376 type:complete len:201 (+) Transcript_54817:37-639(+)
MRPVAFTTPPAALPGRSLGTRTWPRRRCSPCRACKERVRCTWSPRRRRLRRCVRGPPCPWPRSRPRRRPMPRGAQAARREGSLAAPRSGAPWHPRDLGPGSSWPMRARAPPRPVSSAPRRAGLRARRRAASSGASPGLRRTWRCFTGGSAESAARAPVQRQAAVGALASRAVMRACAPSSRCLMESWRSSVKRARPWRHG